MVAELSLRIRGGSDAPSDARRALRSINADLAPELIQVIALLVSELVSNAVRHARADSVELEVRLLSSYVRVDVADHGPGFTSGRNPEIPGADGGWGLFLVDQLAARWGVHDGGGTRVWFELER